MTTYAYASVVDLGCISAALFSHVQRFEVMPLELTRSPDHCTICLELTIPNTAAGSAQQVQRVKVYRPFGKAGTEAYRLQVAHADPQFADILQGMTEGRITLESAVSDISRILKACCAKAMSGNSQPQPRSGQGPPGLMMSVMLLVKTLGGHGRHILRYATNKMVWWQLTTHF